MVNEKNLKLIRKVSLLFTIYEEVGHGVYCIPENTKEMLSVNMRCVGDDLECTERKVSICTKDWILADHIITNIPIQKVFVTH